MLCFNASISLVSGLVVTASRDFALFDFAVYPYTTMFCSTNDILWQTMSLFEADDFLRQTIVQHTLIS